MQLLIDSKDAERLTRDQHWKDLPVELIADTVVHFAEYAVLLELDDCNDVLRIRLVFHDNIKRILKTLADDQLAKLGLERISDGG